MRMCTAVPTQLETETLHLETKKGLQESALGSYLLGWASGHALFITLLTKAHNIKAIQ